MNCDECLNRIEEYLDGDVDFQFVEPEFTHISNCRDCEQEFEYLQQERKVFNEYQDKLKAPIALRAGLIEAVKAEQGASVLHHQLESRFSFSDLFQTWRTSYLAAGLAAAVLLGVSIWLSLSLISKKDSLNAKSTDENYSRTKTENRDDSENGKSVDKTQLATKSDNSFNLKSPHIKSFREKTFAKKEKSKRSMQNDFDDSALPAKSFHIDRKDIKDVTAETIAARQNPIQLNSFETEIARQLEQAQLLLRSFKNTPLTESSTKFEVAYDSQQAGELLQKNILLRRSAKEQGNFRVEEILDDLEPYLMDIANLRDDTAPAVISDVKSRIREREIVATLQVYGQQSFTLAKYRR